MLLADIEPEGLDASDIHARRPKSKEITTPKLVKSFIFPIADGTAKLFGRDHEFREPTPRRDQRARSEEHRGDLQENSEKSQPIDETKDDAGARNDFWSMEGDFIYRHHVEHRCSMCRKRKHSRSH